MSKSKPSKTPSNPSEETGIHVSKTTKIGASGVVVGALVAGPIGALLGGVLGTALGAAASNPVPKDAVSKKPAVSPVSTKSKPKANSQRTAQPAKKKTSKSAPATKKKR